MMFTEITTSTDEFSEAIQPFVRYHTEAHSNTQIDFFMLGGGGEGHPWGMYRQALRELNGREGSLRGIEHTLALAELELEELEHKRANAAPALEGPTSFEPRRLDIQIAHLKRQIAEDKKRAARALREGQRILEQAALYEARIRAENNWAPDYELTEADLHRLDEEFWIHVLRQRCAIHHLQGKPAPVDVVQMLPLLPDRMAKPLREALINPVRNVDEFGFVAERFELREPPRKLQGIG